MFVFFRLRNDLYCVEWGVKLYSLTHLDNFDGLMRLFSLETKKVNFLTTFPYFLSPEDFRDAFCYAGGAFGRPWLQWIERLT